MSKLDEVISKSLDEIDTILKGIATDKEDTISKAVAPKEEVPPEEVSEDAPKEDVPGEGDPEEGNPEEGAGEGEPEEGNPEEGAEQDTDEDDMAEKSLETTLRGNEAIRKSLEVSEFLSELVKSISGVVGAQSEELKKSQVASQETQGLLVKSFEGIVKSQKAILEVQVDLHKSVKAISARLTAIEGQPVIRKSVAATPVDKSFAASSGNAPKSDTISKAEASHRLMSAFEGGDRALHSDILALDGTGDLASLSPHAKTVLGLK